MASQKNVEVAAPGLGPDPDRRVLRPGEQPAVGRHQERVPEAVTQQHRDTDTAQHVHSTYTAQAQHRHRYNTELISIVSTVCGVLGVLQSVAGIEPTSNGA